MNISFFNTNDTNSINSVENANQLAIQRTSDDSNSFKSYLEEKEETNEKNELEKMAETKQNELIAQNLQLQANSPETQTQALPSDNVKSDKINVWDLKMLDLKNNFQTKSYFKVSESKNEFSVNINNIDKKDIDFFKTCIDTPNVTFNNYTNQITQQIVNKSSDVSYKSIDVSKGLVDLIEKAQKSQKPVRFNFSDDSAVILKITKDGTLSASFLSNDSVMEQLIKSNLASLRNKMDAEGIPYKEITYKERNNKQNKGDKSNE